MGIYALSMIPQCNNGQPIITDKDENQTKQEQVITPKTDHFKIYSQINQGLDKYNILPGTGFGTPKSEVENIIEKYVKGLDVEPQAKAEKPRYKGLVDFLKSNKINPDQETRENIFYGLGMDGEYQKKNNAEQNIEMLKQLRGKTPDELKALAAYEDLEPSYAQKKVQEIRENKLEQLTQPKIIPEYGPVIKDEIVNEYGLDIKNITAEKNRSLEEVIVEPEDSQFMTYVKEQGVTTAIGIKTKKDIFGESHNRSKIGSRVNEDLDNARLNLENSLYGLKETVKGIFEHPGKWVNGFSWGVCPDYELTDEGVNLTYSKTEGSIVGKIFYPLKKIIGEGIFEDIINPTLDTAQGITFATANLVQLPFSATLGCTEPTRYMTDGLFNTVYLTADALIQNFPGGDASARVHSTDLREGWKGIPFVKNCYTKEHQADLAGINENLQKDKITIENTTFRKHLETPVSIAEDILLFQWLSEELEGKDSKNPSPKKDPNGIGGGQNTSSGMQ